MLCSFIHWLRRGFFLCVFFFKLSLHLWKYATLLEAKSRLFHHWLFASPPHPPSFLPLHPHNRWFYVTLEWLITQVGSGISLLRAELRQWGVALRGWHLSNAPVIRRTSFIRLTSVDSKKLNFFFLFLTSELQECWNFGCIFLLLFFPGWPFVVRVVSQATCRLTKLWSFSYRCHYLLLPLSFSFPWICLLRLVRRSSSGIVC